MLFHVVNGDMSMFLEVREPQMASADAQLSSTIAITRLLYPNSTKSGSLKTEQHSHNSLGFDSLHFCSPRFSSFIEFQMLFMLYHPLIRCVLLLVHKRCSRRFSDQRRAASEFQEIDKIFTEHPVAIEVISYSCHV